MSANKILETDYLIIGSGAVGMAFADTIMTETDATVLLVDKHDKPGGHWNDAYPFVTLHQPSAFYGVNSRPLGDGKKDKTGLNQGLYELATGAEVSEYFVGLMNEQFLPSGRVQYYPECEVKENADGFFTQPGADGYHSFVSIKTGEEYKVKVNKKVVDGTYFKTSVPSTHTPNFSIEEGVNFIILNDLPKTDLNYSEYVVVGAGKTAMDAVIWMLEHKDIKPEQITWVMSRDSWIIDRENTQPSGEFFRCSIGSIAKQMEALAKAEDIDDLFVRLEKCGAMLRIDKNVQPKMFHGATISRMELEKLRRIKNVVRMGRVKTLQKGNMIMDQGNKEVSENALFIDCSASAVPPRPHVPVFNDKIITVQTVRTVQPAFSAAFIAHIEAAYDDADEVKKNKICGVVPLPNHHTDWIKVTYTNMINQYIWGKEPGIREWLRKSRLDGFTDMVQSTKPYHLRRMMVLKKLRDHARPAMARAKEFMQELGQV